MKKLLFALFSGIFVILAFSSCKKYEEAMYNKSDYQIKYIWYKSNSGEPNETFTYDKKKMLTQIDIVDSAHVGGIRTEAFSFTYNKDKTVESITHVNGDMTETVNFTYLNRYVKYMTYSINGDIRLTCNFYRDDEKAAKITRIVEIYDRQFFEDMQLYRAPALFNRFIGDYAKVEEMAAAHTKDLTLYCTKNITYDGENIVKIEEDYPDIHKSILTTIEYSSVLNPYYGLNYCYDDDLLGYSKNAAGRKTVSTFYDGTLTNAETTEYDYIDVNKDNYPRVFTYTTGNNSLVHFKTYLTYVKEYKD
ncbi:MAG: hypothetical protein J6X16_02300 [Bacteroidales bacterium]|nr:hypothetical protein [Bacteroidales bacterium]